MLIVCGGLPGTGKTTLARGLARELGGALMSSWLT
jgi:predicted kinase